MKEIVEDISKPTFKRVFLLILFAIVALLFISFLPVSTEPLVSKEVTLVIDYGKEGGVRKFTGAFEPNMKAWDVLQQAEAHADLGINVASRFYIDSIGPLSNGAEGRMWHLYINSIMSEESPIEVRLSPGDIVLWKFE